jgi:hypothetical protein
MEFNSYIHDKKFLDALDKFYHPEVVSAVNEKAPVVGIDNLRNAVGQFMENAHFHKIEIVSLLIENNLSVTNWYYSFEHKQYGAIDHHQFSVQRWKDNTIIQEQHFYVM